MLLKSTLSEALIELILTIDQEDTLQMENRTIEIVPAWKWLTAYPVS